MKFVTGWPAFAQLVLKFFFFFFNFNWKENAFWDWWGDMEVFCFWGLGANGPMLLSGYFAHLSCLDRK